MIEDAFVKKMQRYMPERICRIIYSWLVKYPVKVRISKPRKTKLGDYRIGGNRKQPIISVNGDLNPYAFTVTLTHEIAHHVDFLQRKTLESPHGSSWKSVYSDLLLELLAADAFPDILTPAIARHIKNPKAASCSDPVLLRELRAYDLEPKTVLSDLPEGAEFIIVSNQRLFQKGKLKRTRFLCTEIQTNKRFMVHGECEVSVNHS
jgi:SprT protein